MFDISQLEKDKTSGAFGTVSVILLLILLHALLVSVYTAKIEGLF